MANNEKPWPTPEEIEADIRRWLEKRRGRNAGSVALAPPPRRHHGEFNPLDDQYYYLHYNEMNYREWNPRLRHYNPSEAFSYRRFIYRGH